MRNQITLFIIAVTLFTCSKVSERKMINVRTDYNIETLFICFEIADKGFWNFPFKDYQPIKEKVRSRFRTFQDHEAIQLIDTLVSHGFWLDAMTEVMLKSSPIPESYLMYELDVSTQKRLPEDKASELINRLVNALNKFYRDADLETFFKTHQNYYQQVNNEVLKNLPSKHFITTMEDYYGKQNESYTLIPSPTLYHTMGFGKRIKANKGFKVFNVFGPLIVTKDSLEFGYGFNDVLAIDELTVHEFGHSFINPVTERPENERIIDSYEYLFEPIKKDMQEQGYRNWRTCVAEHIVRLGEIRISYAMGDSTRAERIREHYIHNRKFIYLEALEKNILNYESRRSYYKSIDDYLPELLKAFRSSE